MEISKFVSEVLVGIFEGVSDAQVKIEEKGGEINPGAYTDPRGEIFAIARGMDSSTKKLCIAEFNVALSVTDNEQKGGKIGVLFANLGAGGSLERGNETSNVTSVKFSVPYILP